MPRVHHLDFYCILAFLQGTRNLYLVGRRPSNTTILAVNPHVSDILHVGERQPSTPLRYLVLFQLPRRRIAGVSAEVAYSVVLMLTPVEKWLVTQGQTRLSEGYIPKQRFCSHAGNKMFPPWE